MDEDAKKKIALFRFSLIAPLLNQTFLEPTASAYLAAISAKIYDVPFYGNKEYAPATIKGWLLDYRKHGSTFWMLRIFTLSVLQIAYIMSLLLRA